MYFIIRSFFTFIFLFFIYLNLKIIYLNEKDYYLFLFFLLYIPILSYYYYKKNLAIKALIKDIIITKYSNNIYISKSLNIKTDIINKIINSYSSNKPLYIISLDEYSKDENLDLHNSAFSYKNIKLSFIVLGSYKDNHCKLLPLLAHELEHINKNHLYIRKIFDQFSAISIFILFYFLYNQNLFITSFILVTFASLYTYIKITLIRSQEYSADKASYKLSGREDSIALLNTINDDSKGFQPHPKAIDRIKRIESYL
jgi:Zn-dependent protease with chaperone function